MSKQKGPWTVLDSKQIYQNPWITVIEDKVIHPDGNEGIFGTILARPGVNVIVLDNEQNIYLVDQYRYAIERHTLEIPSGAIDDNEEPLDTAKRELHEETGIIANKWTDLGTIDPLPSFVNSPQKVYLAEELRFVASHPEGSEELKVVKLPLPTVYEYIDNQKITDAATIVALLKLKSLR